MGQRWSRYPRSRRPRIPTHTDPPFIQTQSYSHTHPPPHTREDSVNSTAPEPYLLPQTHGVPLREFLSYIERYAIISCSTLLIAMIPMLTLISAVRGQRLFDYVALAIRAIFLGIAILTNVHVQYTIEHQSDDTVNFEYVQNELTVGDTEDCFGCYTPSARKTLFMSAEPAPAYGAIVSALVTRFSIGMRAALMFEVLGCASDVMYCISNGTPGFYVFGVIMYACACVVSGVTTFVEDRAWADFRDEQEELMRGEQAKGQTEKYYDDDDEDEVESRHDVEAGTS